MQQDPEPGGRAAAAAARLRATRRREFLNIFKIYGNLSAQLFQILNFELVLRYFDDQISSNTSDYYESDISKIVWISRLFF
jgi:hypothetical protein